MRSVQFRLEATLLKYCQHLVPSGQRAEWLRLWQAELWYEHRHSQHNLSMGVVCDALWLRTDDLRQWLSGTAGLCLALLALLVAVAGFPAVLFGTLTGSLLGFSGRMMPRFLVASCLTLFVSYATSFASDAGARLGGSGPWLRAWTFHAAKVLLLLMFSALVSIDVCLPLEAGACFAALPLEMLVFVTVSLLGLRWNFIDGQCRCRNCLRSLAPPQRVGRPSWNFLEYNGTELACRDGHGLLTIPELETSWCRSSAWIAQLP